MNPSELSAKQLAALFNSYFDRMAVVEMERDTLKKENKELRQALAEEEGFFRV